MVDPILDAAADIAGEALGAIVEGATETRSRRKRWGCVAFALISFAIGMAFWWFS